MRRASLFLLTVLGVLFVAAPAYAFAHDRLTNPYLHAALDVLTLAVLTAPLWTAYLWGGRHRGLLVALVAFVQLPVAVIAFVPIPHPGAHTAALLAALAITAGSLWAVRRVTRPVREARPTGRAHPAPAAR